MKKLKKRLLEYGKYFANKSISTASVGTSTPKSKLKNLSLKINQHFKSITPTKKSYKNSFFSQSRKCWFEYRKHFANKSISTASVGTSTPKSKLKNLSLKINQHFKSIMPTKKSYKNSFFSQSRKCWFEYRKHFANKSISTASVGTSLSRGFSLMEIMIALIILASMATFLISNVASQQKKARVSQAKILLSQVSNSLEIFQRDCSFYPTSEEGLDALVEPLDRCISWGPEPYLRNGKLPQDPWGNQLIYEYDESLSSYELFSLGSDRKEGGEGYAADLSSKDL